MKLVLITATAAAAAVFALTGCSSTTETAATPSVAASQPATPVKVSVAEWVPAALSPGTVIVDVRTPAEFASGHVVGAVNIPVESSDFASRIAALDPQATYAVYCRTGSRSASATQIMAGMGYVHVYDLNGGFSDLLAAGVPTA